MYASYHIILLINKLSVTNTEYTMCYILCLIYLTSNNIFVVLSQFMVTEIFLAKTWPGILFSHMVHSWGSISLYHTVDKFNRRQMDFSFLNFSRKQDLTLHANCLQRTVQSPKTIRSILLFQFHKPAKKFCKQCRSR